MFFVRRDSVGLGKVRCPGKRYGRSCNCVNRQTINRLIIWMLQRTQTRNPINRVIVS
jgi:hypothetical protein